MGENGKRRAANVPATLDGWTLQAIKSLLELDMPENGRFDWKEMFPREGNGPDRLVASAVAMANSGGGFLVFGVTDHGQGSQRLVGIEISREFGNRFNNLVRRADPPVPYEIRQLELGNDRWVQVVQIFARLAPHSFDGKFSVRRAGGADGYLTTAELRQMFISADVREAIGLAEIDKVTFRFNVRRPWPDVERDLETLAQFASEGTLDQQLAVLEALRRLASFTRYDISEQALHAVLCRLHEIIPGRRGIDVDRWRRALELVIRIVGHIGYDVVLYLQRGPAVVEVARLLSEGLARALEEGEEELAALAISQFAAWEEATARTTPEPFNDAARWLEYQRSSPCLFDTPPPARLIDVQARLFGL